MTEQYVSEQYDEQAEAPEVEALARTVVSQFEQYIKLNKKIPPEILTSIAGIDDAGRLADTIAAHLGVRLADKQKLLDNGARWEAEIARNLQMDAPYR